MKKELKQALANVENDLVLLYDLKMLGHIGNNKHISGSEDMLLIKQSLTMKAYIYRNKITFDRGLLDDYIFTTINEYREDYATDEEIAMEWKKVKVREITLPQLLKIIAIGYILMEAQ